jgi:homoserine dehydrogenase
MLSQIHAAPVAKVEKGAKKVKLTTNLCLCGFGNVGRQFVRLLAARHSAIKKEYGIDLRLVAVFGSQGGIYDSMGLDLAALSELPVGSKGLQQLTELWSERFNGDEGLAAVKADIWVEATPTELVSGQPGIHHFQTAINQGMDIVTFTKGPLVKAYRQLHELAASRGVVIKASGATAAALPTLDVGQYCLAGDTILQFEGILNGTTNYILTRMGEDNLPYEQALAEARAAGVAELDPRLDVEGWDTASKTIILANSLMDTVVDLKDVSVVGIQGVTIEDIHAAQQRGETIKLIGRAARSSVAGVVVTVGPQSLPLSNPLAAIKGTAKGIRFVGESMGEIMVTGGRSDLTGTAAAGLKDIVNLVREKA